jgi:hypothetical protein
MDTIIVKEVVDSVIVQDAETRQPVTIKNQNLQVTDSSSNISVEASDDQVTVTDSPEIVAVEEKSQIITPVFKEVLQIIQQVPQEDEVPYKEEIDFVGEDTVYRGWSNPGTTSDLPLWRIRRTRFIGAEGDVIHDWADGNGNFDNVWDDRLSKPYS